MTAQPTIPADKPKPGHTDLTWRRLAALREMASLGCGCAESARMIGMPINSAGVLCCLHKISFRQNRRETPLRRAIRAGYAAGDAPAAIADRTGSTVGSVKALASKMGLTSKASRDTGKHIRGYEIPPRRKAEYKALRKLGLTIKECGYVMGLLQRPAPRAAYARPSITDTARA